MSRYIYRVSTRLGELHMDFVDVVFTLSRAWLSTTFRIYCGRGESFGTTTCFKTVPWGKQGHATCKIPVIYL